jgi:hypothetical protein
MKTAESHNAPLTGSVRFATMSPMFKISEVDYDTLVKASEILHAKLDRLNAGTRKEKRIAKACASQFKMLVEFNREAKTPILSEAAWPTGNTR